MPRTVDIQELLKLSAKQRGAIVAALLESLEDESMPKGPSDEVLKQRMAEYEADPSIAIPWEEARKRLGWK